MTGPALGQAGPPGEPRSGVPLLPTVLAAFHVLGFYVQTGAVPFTIVRAAIAAVLVGVTVTILASRILRDRGQATLIATAAIFAIIGWRGLPQLAIAALLVLLVTIALPRLLRIRFPWVLVVPAGNGLAFILMVTLLISAAQNGTLEWLPRDIGWALAGPRVADRGSANSMPDIYVLMLEDYPRADFLERVLGIDNSPFLTALEERGFTVSPKSRSNYSNTELTLLTMFQGRHVEAIPELDQLRAARQGNGEPLLRGLMNSGPILDVLRDYGYSIVATSAGYGQLELVGADRFHRSAQINDFETAILQTTIFSPVVDRIAPGLRGQQLRDRIQDEFDFIRGIAQEAAKGPRFVFVHVPAPHPPLVYGPGGQAVTVSFDDPFLIELADPGRFRTLYSAEIEYLNGMVLKAVDQLAKGPRAAVTIVMSDEGAGFVLVSQTSNDTVGLVSNLFAARVPGREDLFGPAITPVNVFPILLDRYLGTSLPRQTDRNYISSSDAPFDGFDIANTDAQPSP